MLDRGNTNGGVYHYQSGVAGDQPARDEIEWWGMPPLIYAIERTARKWTEQEEPQIQIGDLSRPQGGIYWEMKNEAFQVTENHKAHVTGKRTEAQERGSYAKEDEDEWFKIDHSTHDEGLSADVRPMVKSTADVGKSTRWNDPNDEHYDAEGSKNFLTLMVKTSPAQRGVSMCYLIYFNDIRMRTQSHDYYVPQVEDQSNHDDHFHIMVGTRYEH